METYFDMWDWDYQRLVKCFEGQSFDNEDYAREWLTDTAERVVTIFCDRNSGKLQSAFYVFLPIGGCKYRATIKIRYEPYAVVGVLLKKTYYRPTVSKVKLFKLPKNYPKMTKESNK